MKLLRIPKLVRSSSGAIGIALVSLPVLVAIIGPLCAPYSPTALVSTPASPPSSAFLLGTDTLGRDPASRLLNGGRSLILLAAVATVLTYCVGIGIGLVAGYVRSFIDPLLMRGVDLLLSFPALLVLLVLATALGTGEVVLLLGVVLVMSPGAPRIVRTATQEVSVRGYVEAAVVRGESSVSILRREILPNIVSPIMADLGIRFSGAIVLIASMNFLGLGQSPPGANWGLMISENRSILSANVWPLLAPAIAIGVLTIGVNLVSDAFARTYGRSGA